jgi:hypothetical protein
VSEDFGPTAAVGFVFAAAAEFAAGVSPGWGEANVGIGCEPAVAPFVGSLRIRRQKRISSNTAPTAPAIHSRFRRGAASTGRTMRCLTSGVCTGTSGFTGGAEEDDNDEATAAASVFGSLVAAETLRISETRWAVETL